MSDKQWHGHYPEPMRKAPNVHTKYWIADYAEDSLTSCFLWYDDSEDFLWLKRGLIHTTREAAETHARFEIEQAGGVV